jgi:hypothetical protein
MLITGLGSFYTYKGGVKGFLFRAGGFDTYKGGV